MSAVIAVMDGAMRAVKAISKVSCDHYSAFYVNCMFIYLIGHNYHGQVFHGPKNDYSLEYSLLTAYPNSSKTHHLSRA